MNIDYQGEDSRWVNQYPADDLSVRCYMEAAWEHLNGLLDARAEDCDEFPSEMNLYMLPAAAVDADHRYTLEEVRIDGQGNLGYRIKTW